jgi:hypothetical protein
LEATISTKDGLKAVEHLREIGMQEGYSKTVNQITESGMHSIELAKQSFDVPDNAVWRAAQIIGQFKEKAGSEEVLTTLVGDAKGEIAMDILNAVHASRFNADFVMQAKDIAPEGYVRLTVQALTKSDAASVKDAIDAGCRESLPGMSVLRENNDAELVKFVMDLVPPESEVLAYAVGNRLSGVLMEENAFSEEKSKLFGEVYSALQAGNEQALEQLAATPEGHKMYKKAQAVQDVLRHSEKAVSDELIAPSEGVGAA